MYGDDNTIPVIDAQQHHDHYVALYHQNGGALELHELLEFEIALWRERDGVVQPLEEIHNFVQD